MKTRIVHLSDFCTGSPLEKIRPALHELLGI